MGYPTWSVFRGIGGTPYTPVWTLAKGVVCSAYTVPPVYGGKRVLTCRQHVIHRSVRVPKGVHKGVDMPNSRDLGGSMCTFGEWKAEH